MKKIIKLIPFFAILLIASGCAIYDAAVDERNVSTIASDTTIKGSIVKKFFDDDKIKSLDISTGCYRGHVYLVGEYDSAVQKDRGRNPDAESAGLEDVRHHLRSKFPFVECGLKAFEIELQ